MLHDGGGSGDDVDDDDDDHDDDFDYMFTFFCFPKCKIGQSNFRKASVCADTQNSPALMEPKGLSLHSLKPVTGLFPKFLKSGLLTHAPFV